MSYHNVQQPQPQQLYSAQQQDDLAIKTKQAFRTFDAGLKTFLHEYSSILQMDDAQQKSQTPDVLAQFSQNLVRRYEALLVAFDLFELNIRMLQDYTSTQSNFRRFMPTPQTIIDSCSYPGHPPMPLLSQIGRPIDPVQYQFLLSKMQIQTDSLNTLRDLGKKFLETSSINLNPTTTSTK